MCVCLEQGGWVEPGDHPHYSSDWTWQRTHQLELRRQQAPPSGRLPGRDEVLAGADVERRRRLDQRLRRDLAALPARPTSARATSMACSRTGRSPTRTWRRSTRRPTASSAPAASPATPPCRRATRARPGRCPSPGPPRGSAEAFDKLGWHWWPAEAGVISENYDGRPGCNGCGICNGCPRGSMSKFSLSIWPKALTRRHAAAHPCARAQDRDGAGRPRHRRPFRRPQHGRDRVPGRQARHRRRQRRRHAAAAARLRQSRQQLRSGRAQPSAPYAGQLGDLGRRADREPHGLCRLADRPRIRRDRRRAAASSTASSSTA